METGTSKQQAVEHASEKAAERHMMSLQEQLPQMLALKRRIERHHAAKRVLEQYECVSELQQSIDTLTAERDSLQGDPQRMRMWSMLMQEKQSRLRRESSRYAHDLKSNGFANEVEAYRCSLGRDELRGCEERLNRFREEYACTLAQCITE
jgi:hypothetical protein